MSHFVVDTNVPVVASGRHAKAAPECVINCVDALEEIYRQGIVIIDDADLILREYRRKLNMSGQPGLGDGFMKWIHSVQADERHCKQVRITPLADNPDNFLEFPTNAHLTKFDPHDRKFVAVAMSSKVDPEILNAVDSDWAKDYTALTEAGLHIKFLCPQHVKPVR